MSDDKQAETAEETAETQASAEKGASKKAAPTSILSRDSDLAARPGFRSPSNKRTKAQQKKRKKR